MSGSRSVTVALKVAPAEISPFLFGFVDMIDLMFDPKISLQKIGGFETLEILKYPYFLPSPFKSVTVPESSADLSVTFINSSGLSESFGKVVTLPMSFGASPKT